MKWTKMVHTEGRTDKLIIIGKGKKSHRRYRSWVRNRWGSEKFIGSFKTKKEAENRAKHWLELFYMSIDGVL